jgi:hypothetical protein
MMSDNVLAFPGNKTNDRSRSISSSGRPYRVRGEKNMHTLLFRSRESILQSDEPDLELSPKVGDGGNRKGGISWGA